MFHVSRLKKCLLYEDTMVELQTPLIIDSELGHILDNRKMKLRNDNLPSIFGVLDRKSFF